MDTPEILYHYTDAKGLHGILDSKQIWASSYRFMSDARELEYGFDLISEIYPRKEGVQGLLSDFHVEISDSSHAETIKNLKNLYNYDGLFVASFSAIGDSLGQWRGYAGLHSGYSLGFRYDVLKSIDAEAMLVACCYDKQQQIEIISKIIEKYLPSLKNIFSSYKHERLKEFIDILSDAAIDMAIRSTNLKHPAFKEEKEWRLVIGPLVKNSERICYRPGERVIIPYVKIDFTTSGLPLRRIIVGPGPHQQRNVESLQQMLVFHKLSEVEVVASEVPFRTW